MKVIGNKIIILIALTSCVACVSMRKFTRIESQYDICKKDSIRLESEKKTLDNFVNALTLSNIRLGQDTLRLFNQYYNLSEKYDKDIEESRQEIVRLNSQLYGNRPKNYAHYSSSSQKSSNVIEHVGKSVSRLSNDIKTILGKFYKGTYNVENKGFEIVLTLRDTLLFEKTVVGKSISYDHSRLSYKGRNLITQLGNMIVEKDNFDVVVKEYIYVNNSELKYIPPVRDKDEQVLIPSITPLDDKHWKRELSQIEIELNRKDSSVVYQESDSTITPRPRSYFSISLQHIDTIRNIINKEYKILTKLNSQIIEQEDKVKMMYGIADRSSTIMKNLMKQCYNNLGDSQISRDVSYIKSDSKVKNNPYLKNDWVVIVLKLRMDELNNLVKKTEKR